MKKADRSRIARGNRKKGHNGEREAAAALTKIFYPSGNGKFVRSPHSGTWGHESVMLGDVVPILCGGTPNFIETIDRTWPFVWEVKRCDRKAVSVYGWLSGELGILSRWMRETTVKLKSADNIPIVLWRTDHMEWCVVMWEIDINRMVLIYGPIPSACSVFYHRNAQSQLVMMSLKSWAYWFTGGRNDIQGNDIQRQV